MNNINSIDTCEPDFADIVAATAYSVLLISVLLMAA